MDAAFDRVALIDYGSDAPTPYVSYAGRLPLGGVTFSRCAFPANPGVTLGSTQAIVAVHSNPPFQMEWRNPGRDALDRRMIAAGAMNVNRADLPVFHRWSVTARALVIGLDSSFVAETFVQAFERPAEDLPVIVGAIDPTVQRVAALCDHEIAKAGAAGRLYAEGLATSLLVHLFHKYGTSPARRLHVAGGLTPGQLRQVTEYIESRLGQDLGLADLALVTGLSTHHFGQAFKASTGIAPHRYVIERRIHRARELIIAGDRSINQIAEEVGFSSQSHLTLNFRKLTGVTPGQFRRETRPNASGSSSFPGAEPQNSSADQPRNSRNRTGS